MKTNEATLSPEASPTLAVYSPNGSEENRFISQALQQLGDFLQWSDEHTTLEAWAEATLQTLIPFVKGLQATFFVYSPQDAQLNFRAGYAIDTIHQLKKTYQLGEGLVGQVAKDREPMLMDNHEIYARISSLQKVRLKTLMILPLLHKQKLLGVIEINFSQTPPPYVRNFIFKTLEGISAKLHDWVNPTLPQTESVITDEEDRTAYESVWRSLSMLTEESIVLVDKDWKIIDYNPAFGKLFGDKNNEGQSFKSYLNVMSYDILSLKEKIEKGQTTETIGIHKNGHTFKISLQSFPNNADFQGIIVRPLPNENQEDHLLDESAEKIKLLERQLQQSQKKLNAHLQVAKKVQEMQLLPQEALQALLPELFIFYKPCEDVGGDFYWFTQEGNQWVIACIDCVGRGVAGALRTLNVSQLLTQIVNVQKITTPNEILQQLHAYLNNANKEKEAFREGVEIGICTLDTQKRTLDFAGAKNSLLYFSDNTLHEIQGDTLAVGDFWSAYELNRTFKNHSLALKIDESLTFYLCTDGFEDQFGGTQGRKFLRKRLREHLQTLHNEPLTAQALRLEEILAEWQQEKPQTDDILLIGFKL